MSPIRGLLLAAPICALTASCSFLEDVPAIQVSAAPSIAATTAGAKTVAKERKLIEPLEFTAVRRAHPLSPADWVLCIRSSTPEGAARYAIFFNADAVKDSRIAVQIDPCWSEPYQPIN